MRSFAESRTASNISSIYTSEERKAGDAGAILADYLGVSPRSLEALGEIDRSATGYLPPAELELVVEEYYARPSDVVRGRERAIQAQSRIVGALKEITLSDQTFGDIAVVSHGGVGCLLLAHLLGAPINRQFEQVSRGGGSYIALRFDQTSMALLHRWRAIETA